MARPWLYHLAKRDANRAKSTCSYQSHKCEILARRQKKRHNVSLGLTTTDTSSGLSNTPLSSSSIRWARTSSDPDYWTSQVDSRHTKFRIYTEGCRKSFVEATAWDYLRTTKTESLSNQIAVLEEFQSHFRRYEDELVQLEGVSKSWQEVHEMTLEVRETIHWLEQLLCEALVGILGFQAAYLAHGYAYQTS